MNKIYQDDFSHRYCTPIWKSEAGYFYPEDWSQYTFTHRVYNSIEKIKRCIVDKEVPVFVRGSLIEEKQPHPKSDIDIVILLQHKATEVIAPEIHTLFPQTIDINAFLIDTLEPKIYLLPLIHLRSMQISGKEFVQKPICIDSNFWDPLWECYAVHRLSNILHTLAPRRVMELKQLIRSVGVIQLRKQGLFSRDIEICLGWLERYDRALGAYARQLWSLRSTTVPLDIAPVRHWVVDTWYDL